MKAMPSEFGSQKDNEEPVYTNKRVDDFIFSLRYREKFYKYACETLIFEKLDHPSEREKSAFANYCEFTRQGFTVVCGKIGEAANRQLNGKNIG